MKHPQGRRKNEDHAVPVSPARGLRTQALPGDGPRQDSCPGRYLSELAPRCGKRPRDPDLVPEYGYEKLFSTRPFMPPAAVLQEPERSLPTYGSRSLPRLPVVFALWRTIDRTSPAARSPILPNRLRGNPAFLIDGEPDKANLAELGELSSKSAECAARCHTHEPAREPQFLG